ncbi:MAG: SDR family oxidoreductase [Actinobacteria bacterium]|nr:SDR family oxidoreductase [Actinomycetota bacterium]
MARPPSIAVVTGASSGIGAAVSRRLAADGVTVVAVARRADRLRAMAAAHPRIVAHPADVTDPSALDALVERVGDEFGRCDVLINNAGVPGGAFSGPERIEGMRHTMRVNFDAAAHCTAVFHQLLAASAPSQVINVASVSGKLGIGPADYVASKFALVGLSEALSLSWAPEGIIVTQLNPGFIATEGFPQRQLLRSPFARLVGVPEDVADAVADVIARPRRERTVPRWYRPLITLRHVAPGVFWRVAARTPRARGTRDEP